MTSPILDEATKLAAALADWARSRGPDAAGSASEMLGAHLGGSRECTICPICQALALLRGAQPEVVEHLSAAAGSLAAAVTALVDSAAPSSRPGPPPPVEHIEVG